MIEVDGKMYRECYAPAEWLILGGGPDDTAYSCTTHLSDMIPDWGTEIIKADPCDQERCCYLWEVATLETDDLPAQMETLYLHPAYTHDWNCSELICCGLVDTDARGPTGTASVQIAHFAKDGRCSVIQACLTVSEMDEVIAGLQEAREALEKYSGAEVANEQR